MSRYPCSVDERDWLEEAIRRALGRPPNRAALRASDAERESVATLLRDGHAEGRLTSVEFEERLTRCYRAKTQGELERLVRDLPPPPAPVALRRRPWFLVPVAVVLFVAAVAAHDHGAILGLLALALVLWLVSGRGRVSRRLR
jgi:uncharacterized protein DUF1707